MKRNLLFIDCLFFLMLIWWGRFCFAESIPAININDLVIEGAQDINIVKNKPIPKSNSVNYLIKSDYPGEDVLSFYDIFFAQHNWKIYFPSAKRKWFTAYEQDKGEWKKVHQYIASWLSPNGNRRAVMTMRYVEHNKNTISDVAGVVCQIHPFNEDLKNFLEGKTKQ